MTVVRCLPYSCTLTAEACGKRHLATIANRGGRAADAYPSCRRCPVGAANAKATGAAVTFAEHPSAYQVRHAPVHELARCVVPGCDEAFTPRAPSARLTPEFARICAVHRHNAHRMVERGATHAEALACVVEGRRFVRPAVVPPARVAPPCTLRCGKPAALPGGKPAPVALCTDCRQSVGRVGRKHGLDVAGAVARLAAVRAGLLPMHPGRTPRRSTKFVVGICTRCRAPFSGAGRCPACREYDRAAYRARSAAGRCGQCPMAALHGATLCAQHVEVNRANAARRRVA